MATDLGLHAGHGDDWCWRVRSQRLGHRTFNADRFGDYLTLHDTLAADFEAMPDVSVRIVWWGDE